MAASVSNSNSKDSIPSSMSTDAIIHSRITNDERPLRRVVKKFHNYTAVAHAPIIPTNASPSGTTEDAREAFLVELASFQLSLKKSMMVCEAEARQVEEYQRERQRIEDEHGSLRGQIEQLKTSLEHAHMERRRKMEYDLIAEKINTLPSREELEQSIQALENDMAAIRTEHETQDRTIRGQKVALDGIVLDLGSLRLMGKDKEAAASRLASPAATPAPENTDMDDTESGVQGSLGNELESGNDGGEVGEVDEKEDGEDKDSVDVPLSAVLNAKAMFGRSHSSSTTSDSQRRLRSSAGQNRKDDEDDIEMGEVAEDHKSGKGKKKFREELEEGEASDSSSALSDPPED
ncbi:hypothetical protein SERLADRAFT_406806 [Serpula lacrymans var. lacrymans S7.9]|uniref:Uncharacterized protein n=1 Tax=Serpula lacrymans var. lacrymans (strain S7.9) TaxID=578457 RepID=F8NMC6_SERL9|nr:uncharacterized protein SERLADRAFT_406806 [Serpula lacrymans var. lacrymans S7.9]EGO27860.1 hypothetical protein SERLADRAFT_406806 [Serpula lacrymans var. lacrymans S7.9]